MDMEIKAEHVVKLITKVSVFTAQQKLWNDKHDERSRDVLKEIKTEQTKIKSAVAELQTQVAAIPCDVHNSNIKALKDVNNAKFSGIEKRMKYLWGSLCGISLAAIAKMFTN